MASSSSTKSVHSGTECANSSCFRSLDNLSHGMRAFQCFNVSKKDGTEIIVIMGAYEDNGIYVWDPNDKALHETTTHMKRIHQFPDYVKGPQDHFVCKLNEHEFVSMGGDEQDKHHLCKITWNDDYTHCHFDNLLPLIKPTLPHYDGGQVHISG